MTKVCRSLVVVLAACALTLAVPAQAQDTDKQFAGSWIHWLQMPSGFVPNLVTIHHDGTLTVTSAFVFGGGVLPSRFSPVHGVWEKVGPDSIKVTSLFFVFDTNGSIMALQRNICTLELAADRDSYTGSETMARTPCSSTFGCPDPLDPQTVWAPAGIFPVTADRMKVVQ